MEEKEGFDTKKLFKGFLITLGIFTGLTVALSLPLLFNLQLSVEEFFTNLLSSLGASLLLWSIPSLIGGIVYVRRGWKGIAWTIGITLAIGVLVFATCVASLNQMWG